MLSGFVALTPCVHSSSLTNVGTAAIIIANTYQRQIDIRHSVKDVVRNWWPDCCTGGRMGETDYSWISQGYTHWHQWYTVSANSDAHER